MNEIWEVDVETGNRVKSSESFPGAVMSLNVESSGNFAYVVGLDSIVEINLNTAKTREISKDEDQDAFNLAQMQSTYLSSDNKHLIVGDSSLGIVIGVDLKTGERRKVIADGRGEGVLYRVDLTTGNNEIVLDKCFGEAFQRNWLLADTGGIQNVYLDESSRTLWITADTLLTTYCGVVDGREKANTIACLRKIPC